MLARLILLALLAPAMPAAATAADPFFDGLAGTWQGTGFVRIASTAREENIRCRITNTLNPQGHELTVRGNCAIGGFFLPVDGALTARGGASYSSTIFKTLARLTASDFTGRRSGSTLSMTFRGRGMMTNQEINANLVIRKRGAGAFDISLSGTDTATKKPYDIGTIRFRGR